MKYCKKCGDEKEIVNGKIKCRHCRWLYEQDYRENNKEKLAVRKRVRYEPKYYGFTIDEYNTLLQLQNEVCAICCKKETRVNKNGVFYKLAVDHDHKTGKIRGLLCSECNKGLGFFRDDIQNLIGALKYLERWGA